MRSRPQIQKRANCKRLTDCLPRGASCDPRVAASKVERRRSQQACSVGVVCENMHLGSQCSLSLSLSLFLLSVTFCLFVLSESALGVASQLRCQLYSPLPFRKLNWWLLRAAAVKKMNSHHSRRAATRDSEQGTAMGGTGRSHVMCWAST
jgi:hypothetical protein